MKCSNIFNYLSIPICFLNAIVLSTNDNTGLGKLTFEDPDNYWPMNQEHSPTHSNENYSELFMTHNSYESSRKPEPAVTSRNIKLPFTMDDIEETFIRLNRRNPVPWKEVEDNDAILLQRICFAAWPEDIPHKKCVPKAKPYRAGARSKLNVEFHATEYNINLLHTDLLRCKCYPNGTKREDISLIEPLYLAKYNDSSVFHLKLSDDGDPFTLKIIGMMPLNLTNITSSSSYLKPPPSRTSSPLTWDLTQTEKEFYILYNIFSDTVKWQAVRDNNTEELEGICTAAWEIVPFEICIAETRPYTNPKHNGIKAKLADIHDHVFLRADFLLCRCGIKPRSYLKTNVDPIYLAKYNSITVFQLIMVGEKKSHNLKVIKKKTLNMYI